MRASRAARPRARPRPSRSTRSRRSPVLRILRTVRPLRAALAVTALLSVGGLAGPISEALATFTSKPTVSMPVSSVLPTPPTGLGYTACGITVLGVLDEQVTLNWTPPVSQNVTGYAIFVAGIQTATVPAGATSYTASSLLAVGTWTVKVRALYGTTQTWFADSAPINISY